MKRTAEVIKKLFDLEAIKLWLEDKRDAEQEKYDSRSERWQEGEKGEEAQQAIDDLDDAANDADNLYAKIEDIFPE